MPDSVRTRRNWFSVRNRRGVEPIEKLRFSKTSFLNMLHELVTRNLLGALL